MDVAEKSTGKPVSPEPLFSGEPEEHWDLDIEAGKSEMHYWRDLWLYRELFYFLAWRDILVRYKQTAIGILWALLQPLLAMLVFTLIFGKLAKFSSDGAPYSIFVFVALLPWQFFSRAVVEAGNSLITNANLISKIYFPRLIIPASSVITALVDFLISAGFLGALMAWYHFAPGWRLLALPLFLLNALAAGLGAGLWIAALNVSYRDFRYIVPFIVQVGMYLSPVGFSSAVGSTVIPEKWRLLYWLNPMVGVIDGFRWAIIGSKPIYMPGFALSTAVVLVMLATGILYFRATEKKFADII